MIWQNDLRTKDMPDDKEAGAVIKDTNQIFRKKNRIKLRVNKKLLFSLVMLSAIALSAGAVTFSWFTSNASSEISKITVGIFKLGLDTNNNSNTVIFDMNNIQPGVSTEEKTITFVNTGTLDMIIKAADFSLTSQDTNDPNSIGDVNAYKFIAYIYKDSETSEPLYKPDTYIDKLGKTKEIPESAEVIQNKINSKLDNEDGSCVVFKAGENSNGDKLICKFRLVLSEEMATNMHQGDTVLGQLKIQARQNVEGSAY